MSCHACHAICSLSLLHAALALWFAKNSQEQTSKVLHLPHNMTMEVSNALRLPGEMRDIFWKHCESMARVTQNDFRHFFKHVRMSRCATPATQYHIRTSFLTNPKLTTSKSHKMPRRPRNLHVVTTWCSPDNAIRKKHATRHVWSATPATPNDAGGLRSAAPPTKNATHPLTTTQKYCACHTKWILKCYETCWNVTKCHACHAKRSYATLETSKRNHFCKTHQ